MTEESMTPRERWLAVLNRRKPDRIPMDYRATAEATEKLMQHLGCKDMRTLLKRLHIDMAIDVGPKYIGHVHSIPSGLDGVDCFGCGFKDVRYGTGTAAGVFSECVYHPLAKYKTLDEIKRKYRWPDPDWWDYSVIPNQIVGWEDYPIRCMASEPFATYRYMRGHRQAFLDLFIHPEIMHFCLDKLFNLCYENTKRIYEQIPGKIIVSWVAEDLGDQNSLMCSPAHIREFLIPQMKRMIDLVHNYVAFVMHHDDGACRQIIPDMIKIGIDVLDPVQWRCKGMDREGLKRDFGQKLIFHGAMDNQYTLAFGSAEEVRQEVRDNIRILGKGGGYILGPCHNIQVISPPENIVAMYEEGYAKGWSAQDG
jgi:uroporphyrinogen decarboxylase